MTKWQYESEQTIGEEKDLTLIKVPTDPLIEIKIVIFPGVPQGKEQDFPQDLQIETETDATNAILAFY